MNYQAELNQKVISKAKAEPVGTIKRWSDGKRYQKQSDGFWKEYLSPRQIESNLKEKKKKLINSINKFKKLYERERHSSSPYSPAREKDFLETIRLLENELNKISKK